jgi:hypothetical protein
VKIAQSWKSAAVFPASAYEKSQHIEMQRSFETLCKGYRKGMQTLSKQQEQEQD